MHACDTPLALLLQQIQQHRQSLNAQQIGSA
jgi:hypothetical protein